MSQNVLLFNPFIKFQVKQLIPKRSNSQLRESEVKPAIFTYSDSPALSINIQAFMKHHIYIKSAPNGF